MNDEIAREFGFDNAAEFHKMVAAVNLSTYERRAAFTHWQHEDGTKAGLTKLLASE